MEAHKPDSVLDYLFMVIHLDLKLPLDSSSLPEPEIGDFNGPLFDFAPGGACLTPLVTKRMVRSYHTVSPLPISAVYFLLRFPSSYLGRALPGTISPWSPDFPRLISRDHIHHHTHD